MSGAENGRPPQRGGVFRGQAKAPQNFYGGAEIRIPNCEIGEGKIGALRLGPGSTLMRGHFSTWPTVIAHYRVFEGEIERMSGHEDTERMWLEAVRAENAVATIEAAKEARKAVSQRRRALFSDAHGLKQHLYRVVILPKLLSRISPDAS